MLAALCVTEPRRRWFGIKRRAQAVGSEFVTAGSGRYIKITAEKGANGQPNWAQIRKAAGREAGRLLLPRGLTPPENSRVTGFQGCTLARQLMRETGLALLKAVAVNPRLVKVTVYDPQAVMPDMPLDFFPYAADVRVVTRRPERYARQEYEAMKRYGAVLTVTAQRESMNGSFLVLAPEGIENPAGVNFSGRGLILSAVRHTIRKSVMIDGYMPRVSHNLLATLPPGCDPELFLAGLYELSGVRKIAARPPEFLRMGEKTISFKDAVWKLAGIDIGISV